MNLKKSLYIFIVLSMLFTGCSTYQVKDNGISLPDEATKQKTMTKVQNDVNEIINKDYKYVLSNLGEPNITEYWIDKTNIDKLETLDNMENLVNINLVYLKNVSNEDDNSSALYLYLKDNIVKEAQIVDYSRDDIIKNLNKSKILINCYTNGDIVKLSDLKNKKVDDFIGIDFKQMSTILNDKQSFCNVYLYDKVEKSINIYYLDNEDKLLSIITKDNKICDIKVIDTKREVLKEIKNIMLDN